MPEQITHEFPALSTDDLSTTSGGIDWKSVGQSAKLGGKVGAVAGGTVGLGTIAALGPIGIPTAAGLTAGGAALGAATSAGTDLLYQLTR